MEFQSIFARKALPEAEFGKRVVIDDHRSIHDTPVHDSPHRNARPIILQVSYPRISDAACIGHAVASAAPAASLCAGHAQQLGGVSPSTQPDGGEGLAKRKGYRREAGSGRSVKQTCESMDKNRIEGAGVGRAGNVLRSPYPSRMRSVDPATVHGRRLRLPQEICLVSRERLRRPRGNLTARQKSAEGVVDHVVGKALEALQSRKAEQQIGRAGNGGRRPEREGEGSRTWVSGTTRGRRTPR